MYKQSILNPTTETNKRRPKSNFIYILFVPFILYLCNFMYNNATNNYITTNNVPTPYTPYTPYTPTNIAPAPQIPDNFLSKPYPLSSNSSSTY